MVFSNFCSFFLLLCNLGAVAVQPVWQAGEPMVVNVDYDVPAFGPQDAGINAQALLNVESGLAAGQIRSHTLSTEGAVKLSTPEHHASSSFLATQVLPVDAGRIKKSLYLTESLRSPPQASVNVIMQEDVQHMKDAAKYEGMVDQTRALQNEFRKGLAVMSNGIA